MAVVRPYRTGDEDGILRLFPLVFQQELPLTVWQWKYLRNGEPPPVFVAEEDDQIVCHLGAIRQRLSWQGVQGCGWDIVDVMCHPRYQGRGLFRRTVQEFMSALCEGQSWLMYGFPTEPHRRLGEILVGYEPVARVYRVRKTLSANVLPLPEREVRLDVLPPDWDSHWRRLETRFGLVNRRDRAYLTWRYLARPGKHYRLVTLPGKTALAVIGLEQGKAHLMEFVVEEGEQTSAALLLTAVETVARSEGALELEGWFAPWVWEYRFLTGPGGFTGETAENYLECRLFDRRLSAAWLAEHFYYSLSDFDVI